MVAVIAVLLIVAGTLLIVYAMQGESIFVPGALTGYHPGEPGRKPGPNPGEPKMTEGG